MLARCQEIVEFRNQPEVAASLNPPNLNDAVLMPAHIHVTGDIRVHEIGWVGEDLWLVNTLFSMLCTLDHDYSFVCTHQLSYSSPPMLFDRTYRNAQFLPRSARSGVICHSLRLASIGA